jgi:hypothetical protein
LALTELLGYVRAYPNRARRPFVGKMDFARTLLNRDCHPVVMCRRTTEELDNPVRSGGLEKIAMDIDDLGIFGCSLARRL